MTDEIATLRALLREAEWASVDNTDEPCCPWCGAYKYSAALLSEAHMPDCRWVKAMQTPEDTL